MQQHLSPVHHGAAGVLGETQLATGDQPDAPQRGPGHREQGLAPEALDELAVYVRRRGVGEHPGVVVVLPVFDDDLTVGCHQERRVEEPAREVGVDLHHVGGDVHPPLPGLVGDQLGVGAGDRAGDLDPLGQRQLLPAGVDRILGHHHQPDLGVAEGGDVVDHLEGPGQVGPDVAVALGGVERDGPGPGL